MKQAPRGFTIVELLIVIVVIAILAAITIISFNSIRARALESEKSSKFSQIVKSLENFKTLNGYYPNNTQMEGPGSAALINIPLDAAEPSDSDLKGQGIDGQSFISPSNRRFTYMSTDGINGSGFQCNTGECSSFILSYYDRVRNQAVTVTR